jgi:hypothetical protein
MTFHIIIAFNTYMALIWVVLNFKQPNAGLFLTFIDFAERTERCHLPEQAKQAQHDSQYVFILRRWDVCGFSFDILSRNNKFWSRLKPCMMW